MSSAPPAKDPARIAGMFDAIAARYDLLNRLLSGGQDRRWRARAVESLGLTGQEVVLDLCTGTADLALAAASSKPCARRVIGVDFAGAMLMLGREKVRKAAALGTTTIDLVRGDATQLPLGNASIDRATIGFGIRNVEQPERACRELARVMRPGGTLAILEFSLPRSAALRSFYLWYFRQVLPIIGRAISRHPTAYSYLPESVEAFPSPQDFSHLLRGSGFSSVRVVPLTFGVVYLFVAVKGNTGAV